MACASCCRCPRPGDHRRADPRLGAAHGGRTPFMKRGQRGAALLVAMLTVTLVATFAAAALWQQWRAVEVEGAERARMQAGWILTGALDWSRLILREDARTGGADHLAEPWAVPLQEARLSTFLAADRNADTSGARRRHLPVRLRSPTRRRLLNRHQPGRKRHASRAPACAASAACSACSGCRSRKWRRWQRTCGSPATSAPTTSRRARRRCCRNARNNWPGSACRRARWPPCCPTSPSCRDARPSTSTRRRPK